MSAEKFSLRALVSAAQGWAVSSRSVSRVGKSKSLGQTRLVVLFFGARKKGPLGILLSSTRRRSHMQKQNPWSRDQKTSTGGVCVGLFLVQFTIISTWPSQGRHCTVSFLHSLRWSVGCPRCPAGVVWVCGSGRTRPTPARSCGTAQSGAKAALVGKQKGVDAIFRPLHTGGEGEAEAGRHRLIVAKRRPSCSRPEATTVTVPLPRSGDRPSRPITASASSSKRSSCYRREATSAVRSEF